MAEKSSFFNAIINNGIPDRTYKAEEFAKYFGSFIGNGVFPNPSTGLQVVSIDNNNMAIRVKLGKAWINGYYYENTDDLILSIDNADGVLKRIDRVVVRLDYVNREITCKIKKGTFASSPVVPVLQRDANIYELGIADILVENGVIAIQQSKITDTRLNTTLCGIVTQTIKEIDTTTLYNQLKADIEEKGLSMSEWIKEAKAFFTNDFNTWFDTIKGALGEDIAGNLLNLINLNNSEIENLKKQVDGIKTIAKDTSFDNSTNGMKATNVQAAIEENKTSILSLEKNKSNTNHTHTMANVEGLNDLKTKVDNGQNHKLTDDSGLAINLGNGADLNNLKRVGLYMGASLKNAPSSVDWFFIDVKAHNDLYVIQTATKFTDATSPKYERSCVGGTWQSWRSL